MVSLKLSAAVLAATIFSLSAHAQYSIDPNSVPISTRTSWCQSQIASCPLLCLQNQGSDDSTTIANDCDPDTLAYNCVCGNGLTPSYANYSQTVPYFECTEYNNQCVANCGGDSSCQYACRSNNPCGAQNPTRINATSTTSSIASTTALPVGATSESGGVVYTGLGGGAVATPTGSSGSGSGSGNKEKNGSQMALDLGRSYGLAIVFASLFAGFALVM